MGGIPRNVRIKVVPPAYLDRFHIEIPEVTNENALTIVNAEIINDKSDPETYQLTVKISDPAGKIVSEGGGKKTLAPGKNNISVVMPAIKKPLLWYPDSPALYTVDVSLKSGKNEIDKLQDKCGYRWYEFKEKGPFYLNGERLLLRGTHRHEEISGYGNAIPDSLHRKDIRMIKELGANFVRLAHYPQAPEVYKACDELGILVWDEVPWCRGGVGDAEWQANTKRLLAEQINAPL